MKYMVDSPVIGRMGALYYSGFSILYTPKGVINMIKQVSLIIACLIFYPLTVVAQEMPVSVDIQLALFSRALKYEQSLHTRVGADTLVVGVVYQKDTDRSFTVGSEVMKTLASLDKFGRYAFRYVPIDLSGGTDLAMADSVNKTRYDTAGLSNKISTHNIGLLYIAPLRNVDPETVTTIARARQILTMTGVPHYVRSGMSIGVDMENDRPRLLFNPQAIRAEGANFSATILRIGSTVN